MHTLQVENVSKTYDKFKAVTDISFSLEEGNMFALLGPNGAGKTTTMRMIMNIILPDSGSIRLFGETFQESHKNRIGYMPEERGLYGKMKVLDQIQFLGEMKGMTPAQAKKTGMDWLEKFSLTDRANKKVHELSKGMQQKVQFIGTVVHSPDLMIIDEPFSGLDPVNTKFMKDVLLDMKRQGTTIILSTHLMEQAEKLSDEICLINKGEILLQGTVNDVKRAHTNNAVTIGYSGDAAFINNYDIVETVNDYGNYMEVRLKDDTPPGKLFKRLAGEEIDIHRFEAAEMTLNEIFIQQIGGADA